MNIENLLRKYAVANAYKNTIEKYNEIFDKEYYKVRNEDEFSDEVNYVNLKKKTLELAMKNLEMGSELIQVKVSKVKNYLNKNIDEQKLKTSEEYFDNFMDNLITNCLVMDELRSLVEGRYLNNRSQLNRETLDSIENLSNTVKEYRKIIKSLMAIDVN
ncbi:MAG: hypothetical protein QW210_01130 [Candidatus Woesearchaeota archaeon]